jgi:hypothetical protein
VPLIVLIVVLDLLVLAPMSAWLALQRGRSPSGWFILGAIIGPIAFLAVGLAPTAWETRERAERTRPCDRCLTLVPGPATRCFACGSTLTPVEAAAPAPAAAPRREPAPTATPTAAPSPTLRAVTGPERVLPAEEVAVTPFRTPESARPDHSVTVPFRALTQPAVPAATSAAPVPPPRPTPPRRGARGRQNLADVQPVATGALIGGDLSLGIGELGERFVVGARSDTVVVYGPIGAATEKAVLQAPRDSVEVTRLPDGFVLTSEPEPGRRVRVAFRNPVSAEVDRVMATLDRDNLPIAHVVPEAPAPKPTQTRSQRAERTKRTPSRGSRRAGTPR